MRRFAEGTTVSVERSRAEIETTLHRYGCQAFSYGYAGERAQIQFATNERIIRFDLPLPPKDQFKRRKVRNVWQNCTPDQQITMWEQACRQKWRALCLAIKAKLEAVQAGISLFEDEFLAHVVDPVTGRTIGDLMKPMLVERYQGRQTGQLCLPAPEMKDGESRLKTATLPGPIIRSIRGSAAAR